jgi:hypothetical protein
VLASVFRTTAVSAVRILKRAQAQGITPYLIDKNTPNLEATLTGLFGMGERVTEMLDKLIGQNQKLFVHNGIQTLENWTGQGYIIWNPENGAGGYMISGALAGGNISRDIPYFVTQLYNHDVGGKHFVVFLSFWIDAYNKKTTWLSFSGDARVPFNITVIIWPGDIRPPDDVVIDSGEYTIIKPTQFEVTDDRSFVLLGINWYPGDIIKYEPIGTGGVRGARFNEWGESCSMAALNNRNANPVILINNGMPAGYTCTLGADVEFTSNPVHTDSAKVQIIARSGDIVHDLPPNPYSYWDIIGPKVVGFFAGYPPQPNIGDKLMPKPPYYVSRAAASQASEETTRYYMIADRSYTPYKGSQISDKLDQYLARSESPAGIDISFANYKAIDSNPGTQNPGRCDDYVRSLKATLYIAMYDLDDDKPFPELVRVKLNGEYLRDSGGYEIYLQSTMPKPNNKWQRFQVEFPACRLTAPIRSTNNQYPGPAMNVVTLDLDNLNQGYRIAIDWAVIQFDAISPTILVHGVNCDSNFWKGKWWQAIPQELPDTDFIDTLELHGMPFDYSITVQYGTTPNGYVLIGHGIADVREGIERATRQFGSFSYGIVAHSKGGLWTRAALDDIYSSSTLDTTRNLSLVSFITLATPHLGSVLGDYVRALYREANWLIDNHRDDDYMQVSYPVGGAPPVNYESFRSMWWPDDPEVALNSIKGSIGYLDLNEESVLAYFPSSKNERLKNLVNFDGSRPRYYAISAVADNDNNHYLDQSEWFPLGFVLDPNSSAQTPYLMNRIYEMHAGVSSFKSTISGETIYLYDVKPRSGFTHSDIYVPLPSALGEGHVSDIFTPVEQSTWWNGDEPDATNHATVCSHEVADHVVSTKRIRPLR